MTPDELTNAIAEGDNGAVTTALRDDPSLIAARNRFADTPLHTACWQKQVGMIGALIAYDPDVNARGDHGRTPLHYAVHEGGAISVPIVAALLQRGADPSLRDDHGFSVEDWAKIEMDDGLAQVLALLRGKP